MLALRPNCECCDRDLPPDSRDAMMCSFECTFWQDCAERILERPLPELRRRTGAARPIRPADKLGEISGIASER